MAKTVKKICQSCQRSFRGRSDAKTCSARCRKQLQRTKIQIAQEVEELLKEPVKNLISGAETAFDSFRIPVQFAADSITADEGSPDRDTLRPESTPQAGWIYRPDGSKDLADGNPQLSPSGPGPKKDKHTKGHPVTGPPHSLRFLASLLVLALLITGVLTRFNNQVSNLGRQQNYQEASLRQSIDNQAGQLQLQVSSLSEKVVQLQGKAGEQGNQGPPGLTGPQGPKGDTGPQGLAGPAGPQGPAGSGGSGGSGSCALGVCISLQTGTPGTPEIGSANISGTLIAGFFQGNGANLSSVNALTLQGLDPSYFANADNLTTGTINNSRLTTAVTLQGNSFNGVSQLVQTTAGGILPVISGANLTSLNGTNISSGTVADARLTTNVTLQGNTFNGISQLVKLDGSGNLPALNGSALTSVNAAQLNGQAASYYTNASNIASGTLADARLTTNVTLQGNSFNGISQLVQTTAGGILPVISGANLTSLNGTNISSGTVADARLTTNVTLQGNTFNGISQLVQTTAGGILPVISGANLTSLNGTNISSGTVADARLSTNVTLQGNSFNGISQLVQTTAGGILPVLSGANLTSLDGTNISSGTIADARLSTNVTLQGNTFNGLSQLVKLDGSGNLPALNASALTSLNGTNISSGTVADARLTTNVALLNASQTFTGSPLFKNGSDSATAFQVQNSSSKAVITVDTLGSQVLLGNTGASGVDGKLVFNNATNSNTVTVVSGATSGSYSITLPTAAPVSGTQCLQTNTGSTTQLIFAGCGGSGLAKNAADTSTAAISASNNLYVFTNSSSAIASGVLKLDNGTNTNSAFSVVGSGDSTATQAYIYAKNSNATPSGNLLELQNNVSAGTDLFTVDATGVTLHKTTTDSVTAWQLQNSSAVAILTGDTSGKKVQIGSASTDANAVLLILDSYNTTDPAGTNGAMYYSTNTNTFRCYENGVWTDCLSHHVIVLGSDVASTASTSFQTLTGLSFSITSGVNYRFHGAILYTASANTIGLRVAVTGSASPTLLAYGTSTGPGSTTGGACGSASCSWTNWQDTYDAGTTSGASVGTTAGNFLTLDGAIRPSASGTLQVDFAPETATASGIVIKAGSTLEWW